MATKNISRTAIEGGRANSWKVLTRHFEKSFRQKSRIFDEDSDYPSKVKPLNMRQYQTDHLNPVFNFIISRVGKPWNFVKIIIYQKILLKNIKILLIGLTLLAIKNFLKNLLKNFNITFLGIKFLDVKNFQRNSL